jgi:hypothetical protein
MDGIIALKNSLVARGVDAESQERGLLDYGSIMDKVWSMPVLMPGKTLDGIENVTG